MTISHCEGALRLARHAPVLAGVLVLGLALGGGAAWADGTVSCNVGAGSFSTECGVDALASGLGATAIGEDSVATASLTTALGSFARATALDATAVGVAALAPGTQSTAIGRSAQATMDDATSLDGMSYEAFSARVRRRTEGLPEDYDP